MGSDCCNTCPSSMCENYHRSNKLFVCNVLLVRGSNAKSLNFDYYQVLNALVLN